METYGIYDKTCIPGDIPQETANEIARLLIESNHEMSKGIVINSTSDKTTSRLISDIDGCYCLEKYIAGPYYVGKTALIGVGLWRPKD